MLAQRERLSAIQLGDFIHPVRELKSAIFDADVRLGHRHYLAIEPNQFRHGSIHFESSGEHSILNCSFT